MKKKSFKNRLYSNQVYPSTWDCHKFKDSLGYRVSFRRARITEWDPDPKNIKFNPHQKDGESPLVFRNMIFKINFSNVYGLHTVKLVSLSFDNSCVHSRSFHGSWQPLIYWKHANHSIVLTTLPEDSSLWLVLHMALYMAKAILQLSIVSYVSIGLIGDVWAWGSHCRNSLTSLHAF